jgi:hypothetical protein
MTTHHAVIVHGPQGCGKTTHAEELAKHFGCSTVVDDWAGNPLPVGALALTNDPDITLPGVFLVVDFETACHLAGISRF